MVTRHTVLDLTRLSPVLPRVATPRNHWRCQVPFPAVCCVLSGATCGFGLPRLMTGRAEHCCTVPICASWPAFSVGLHTDPWGPAALVFSHLVTSALLVMSLDELYKDLVNATKLIRLLCTAVLNVVHFIQ